jgi:Leucine-rich repeat (LRR) protein
MDNQIEMKFYNGAEITHIDYEVLEEIQNSVLKGKKIPRLTDPSSFSSGFVVENKQVVQLAFIEDGLSSLPESVGNLTSLKHIAIIGNPLISLPESFGAT